MMMFGYQSYPKLWKHVTIIVIVMASICSLNLGDHYMQKKIIQIAQSSQMLQGFQVKIEDIILYWLVMKNSSYFQLWRITTLNLVRSAYSYLQMVCFILTCHQLITVENRDCSENQLRLATREKTTSCSIWHKLSTKPEEIKLFPALTNIRKYCQTKKSMTANEEILKTKKQHRKITKRKEP